jgi:hypothetical protein
MTRRKTMSAEVGKTYRNRHTGEEEKVLKREWVQDRWVVETDKMISTLGNNRVDENTFLVHWELVEV